MYDYYNRIIKIYKNLIQSKYICCINWKENSTDCHYAIINFILTGHQEKPDSSDSVNKIEREIHKTLFIKNKTKKRKANL